MLLRRASPPVKSGAAHVSKIVCHSTGGSHRFGNPFRDGYFVIMERRMQKAFAAMMQELGQTSCLEISKSGGTKETRNGMLEARAAYERAGLNFGKHTVAITGFGSELDKYAIQNNWIKRFPMWDWVGGRTSETSAVGLLPAALQGFDIDNLLR